MFSQEKNHLSTRAYQSELSLCDDQTEHLMIVTEQKEQKDSSFLSFHLMTCGVPKAQSTYRFKDGLFKVAGGD
jgi:hypothetical protein